MSAHNQGDEYITRQYCDLCQKASEKAVKAAAGLLDERIKSIKMAFTVGLTVTTLILTAVQLIIRFAG